jgi:regulatory protein
MEKSASSMEENNSSSYKDSLRRAAALCSNQEQCTGTILEKLRTWGVDTDDAHRVIAKLQEEKFLDDRRYAKFYVRDKYKLNRWGKVKITAMLRQKKIDNSVIEEALTEIDMKEYEEICENLIKTKSATLHDSNHFTRKGKLFRFAAGRGFESDLIHRILG